MRLSAGSRYFYNIFWRLLRMNKLLALAAVGLLSVVSVGAQAEDHATHATPAAEMAAPVEIKEVTLKDGTTVSIEGDNVFVVAADGAKTPAPDGEHELADGTKVKTSGGKVVKTEVAPAEAPQE
jgi:hypothetical protein